MAKDWETIGNIGNLIGAAVSTGALVLAACALSNQVDFNKNQVQLNQKIDSRIEQRYALRVAWWWLPPEIGEVPVIRLQNRSPLPMREVKLVASGAAAASLANAARETATGVGAEPGMPVTFYLGILPPCTFHNYEFRRESIQPSGDPVQDALRRIAAHAASVAEQENWRLDFTDPFQKQWSFSLKAGLAPNMPPSPPPSEPISSPPPPDAAKELEDYILRQQIGDLVRQRDQEGAHDASDCGEGG